MKTANSATRLACAAVVLSIGFSARAAFLDQWNSGTGGKPSRNGLVWERGPTNNAILWEGGLESWNGFPPVMEGNIVVMIRAKRSDYDTGGIIVAHDLTTGQILWTNTLPFNFPDNESSSTVVAMRDQRVYATRSGNTYPNYLYALDARTGQILWRSQDTIDVYGDDPSFAPNGDLIFGELNLIKRINATNGFRVWIAAGHGGGCGGNQVAVYGNRIYGWETAKVTAHDPATGVRLYSSPDLGGSNLQLGLFVGPDGTVYAPRSEGVTQSDCLVAFQDTGAAFVEKWRVPLGYVPFASFGVGPDGSVYSYSQDKRLIRIRPQDGVIINSSEIIPSGFVSARMAIDSSGIVFVGNGGNEQGALYSFNPDLTLRWTDSVPDITSGGPAIGKNGTLVVAGSGTLVRAYRGSSYGLPGPPIQARQDGKDLILTYSGTLESSGQPTGVWGAVPGAASPWTVPLTGTREFYRARQD